MSVTHDRTAAPTPYTFSNTAPTATTLLRALSEMHDEFTRRRLTATGMVRAGVRCLEIGAGNGSIACWLAELVGPTGTVIATDLHPQHIPAHGGLTVVEHNLLTDELPDGSFDLIHVRAVLQHLPNPDQLLHRLAAALAPGGHLVVEDMEARWSAAVLATPDPAAHDLFAAYETALTAVLRAAGNDPTWCRRKHTVMLDAGLTDVTTEGWQKSWTGGTGAALLAYSGSTEKHDQLLQAGMSERQLAALATLAMDPALVLRGILLLSTTGRAAA